MDSFISLAKQGYSAYSKSQEETNSHDNASHNDNKGQGQYTQNTSGGNVGKTGGSEYNTPPSGQGSYGETPPIDHDHAVNTANTHAENAGDKDLFSQALGYASSFGDHKKPVDEEHITNSHKQAYEGDASKMDAHSLGSAAALQAFKSYMGGSSEKSSSGGGDTQTKLIGMAMAEAAKLFDKSGGGGSGNKQDAVNGAAGTVMKLLVQSKLGGSTGGKDSGGLSQVMGLAAKFTK